MSEKRLIRVSFPVKTYIVHELLTCRTDEEIKKDIKEAYGNPMLLDEKYYDWYSCEEDIDSEGHDESVDTVVKDKFNTVIIEFKPE